MQYVSRKLRHFLHEDELRGLPMIGGGRMSAIAGSAPERALLEKESRGRLRLQTRPDPIPRSLDEVVELDRAIRRKKKLGRRVIISHR